MDLLPASSLLLRLPLEHLFESRFLFRFAISTDNVMKEIMKKKVCFCIAVLVVLVPALYAAESGRSSSYVQGTVVRVQQRKVYFPDSTIGGSNPSDAPLTSRYYAYEVSARIDCKTFVGRYETPFNYLPSAFTPDQPRSEEH